MSLLDVATKYKYYNIGKGSATLVFLALAGNPSTAVLTAGVIGQFVFSFLTWASTMLASVGIVLANVGVDWIDTRLEKGDFDGAWDEAFKKINEKGNTLTPEEVKAIDDKVIAAHNSFGTFGKLRGDAG